MTQEFDDTAELDEITFDIDAVSGASSATVVRARAEESAAGVPFNADVLAEMSPVFRELADPKLPELPREARARLLMQSPTRLYFYWSTGTSPYAVLDKALGSASGYRLALRLLDLTHGSEELHGVEQEGSWWFVARPDTEYRAEIGFYSPSRPFVRILFSNTVTTPRKGPSPHRSSEAKWMISTGKFADVLEAAGFVSDAAELAIDDVRHEFAERFARHVGVEEDELRRLDLSELQRAVDDLAAGTPIADLKWKVSAELYALLEERLAMLSASSIRESFCVAAGFEGSDETMTAVGGSLINIRKPRYRPVSSLALR